MPMKSSTDTTVVICGLVNPVRATPGWFMSVSLVLGTVRPIGASSGGRQAAQPQGTPRINARTPEWQQRKARYLRVVQVMSNTKGRTGMKLLAIVIAAFAFTASASAAAPIYWTPAHMGAALVSLQYPHAGTLRATCQGITARKGKTFAGFRCLVGWQTDQGGLEQGTVKVWVRPLAKGRVCGSTSSLAACKPLKAGPLAGDARTCQLSTIPSECVRVAADSAVAKHLATGGIPYQGPLTCTTTTVTAAKATASCTAGSTALTVTFTRGVSAWTVAVTP